MIIGWSPNRFEVHYRPDIRKNKNLIFRFYGLFSDPPPVFKPVLERFLIPNLDFDCTNRSGGYFSAGYRLEKLFALHKTTLSSPEVCVLTRGFLWNHSFSYKIRICTSDPQPIFRDFTLDFEAVPDPEAPFQPQHSIQTIFCCFMYVGDKFCGWYSTAIATQTLRLDLWDFQWFRLQKR